MLRLHILKSFPMSRSRGQLALLQDCRAYSSRSSNDSEAADLDAAREWFQTLNKSTIPEKIAKTEFSRSGGPGGQGVNKTNSKATTAWKLSALYPHVPKVLHQGLRDSSYYAHSSDSIKMQCDSSRSQSDNRAENHQKLFDEITRIYKQRVPGITPPEQLKKIEQLTILSPHALQKASRKLDSKAFKKLWHQSHANAKEKKKLKTLTMEAQRASSQRINAASAKTSKNGDSSKARK